MLSLELFNRFYVAIVIDNFKNTMLSLEHGAYQFITQK